MGIMKFTTKSRNTQGWGMGFLLIFFPEEEDGGPTPRSGKLNTLNFLSPSSSIINRTTHSSNLLHKAQSTLSICFLILFATLLLFTLSDPAAPRTRLRQSPAAPSSLPHALQGMGTLYRRGTRAMNDVVLAHAGESLSPNEMKLFLRLFLRSSLASKSDLVLILPLKTANLDGLILNEQKSFVELLDRYGSRNGSSHSGSGFDVTHFKEKESGEPIWGQKTRTNHTENPEPESNRPSYGSVIGFDVDELDPGNSLSGFMDHVPMNFRRWACYPMLLGRVRRNFKHIILVDMKEILLLGDPLSRVRNHTPESVLLKSVPVQPGKHGRRNSESTRGNPVHPGIVMGGSRGVRRLSGAMLTSIVRVSMIQHKKKNPVTELVIFNRLVGDDYEPEKLNLIVSTEPLPELSLVDSKSISRLFTRNYGMVRRGSGNLKAVNSMVMRRICSFPIESIVYSDCCM